MRPLQLVILVSTIIIVWLAIGYFAGWPLP